MNFKGDEGRQGIYRGVVPGFRGAMAFLNLLTLFQGEGVTWAAILSLSVRRQSLKNYGSEKNLGAVLGIVGRALPEMKQVQCETEDVVL